ncbi:DEPDC5 [Acanthosepion pharaonis]|uniref:DEPDC5 n=1 Tax=Acanthosepion pharaonis TaxID=158019 RepID=A0A812DNY0_ACAPH|nr:DEPDC5 [Sepia pharaonis]
MRFKMTSNRRRWVHAFPTDPSGAAVQTHHTSQHLQGFVDECESGESVRPESITSMEKIKYLPKQHCHYTETINSPSSADAMRMGSSLSAYPDDPVLMGRSGSPSHSQNFTWSMTGSYPSHSSDQFKFSSRSVREPYRTYMWGPTGEQEWSPEMTTGKMCEKKNISPFSFLVHIF